MCRQSPCQQSLCPQTLSVHKQCPPLCGARPSPLQPRTAAAVSLRVQPLELRLQAAPSGSQAATAARAGAKPLPEASLPPSRQAVYQLPMSLLPGSQEHLACTVRPLVRLPASLVWVQGARRPPLVLTLLNTNPDLHSSLLTATSPHPGRSSQQQPQAQLQSASSRLLLAVRHMKAVMLRQVPLAAPQTLPLPTASHDDPGSSCKCCVSALTLIRGCTAPLSFQCAVLVMGNATGAMPSLISTSNRFYCSMLDP